MTGCLGMDDGGIVFFGNRFFNVKQIAILDPSTGSLDHRVRRVSSGMSI